MKYFFISSSCLLALCLPLLASAGNATTTFLDTTTNQPTFLTHGINANGSIFPRPDQNSYPCGPGDFTSHCTQLSSPSLGDYLMKPFNNASSTPLPDGSYTFVQDAGTFCTYGTTKEACESYDGNDYQDFTITTSTPERHLPSGGNATTTLLDTTTNQPTFLTNGINANGAIFPRPDQSAYPCGGPSDYLTHCTQISTPSVGDYLMKPFNNAPSTPFPDGSYTFIKEGGTYCQYGISKAACESYGGNDYQDFTIITTTSTPATSTPATATPISDLLLFEILLILDAGVFITVYIFTSKKVNDFLPDKFRED